MVGGWELSWVVIDMDPKANLYNTLSDSNTYMRLCGNGYGGRGWSTKAIPLRHFPNTIHNSNT